MNSIIIYAEAKLFCILIIAFLYFFQVNGFQKQSKEDKLIYLFAFGEILFSGIGGLTPEGAIQNICYVICGSCFAFAVYLCCKYVLNNIECKITALTKAIQGIISFALGFLSFYSMRYGTDIAAFVLTFVIIVSFVVEQNNRIRVDKLTKLYNRYGMDAELKEQLRQYEKENSDSFYVIACDLDKFKMINDTWGHAEGDRALKLIAGALARVGKRFDAGVFRIGGDEFVLITDTSEEGLAAKVKDAIKAELDRIDFRSDFNIQMSIGSALYDGVTPIDELLENADKKLYEAKRSGQ